MTVAMPFLQKLITFLWPPDIRPEAFPVYFRQPLQRAQSPQQPQPPLCRREDRRANPSHTPSRAKSR